MNLNFSEEITRPAKSKKPTNKYASTVCSAQASEQAVKNAVFPRLQNSSKNDSMEFRPSNWNVRPLFTVGLRSPSEMAAPCNNQPWHWVQFGSLTPKHNSVWGIDQCDLPKQNINTHVQKRVVLPASRIAPSKIADSKSI